MAIWYTCCVSSDVTTNSHDNERLATQLQRATERIAQLEAAHQHDQQQIWLLQEQSHKKIDTMHATQVLHNY